jgi:hypothetical protein
VIDLVAAVAHQREVRVPDPGRAGALRLDSRRGHQGHDDR